MTTHEVLAPSALELSPRMSLTALQPVATITNSLVPGEEGSSTLVTQTLEAPTLQSLLSPGTCSLKQAEMMTRLQQLMAWQERQKASLLRQQQEEIMRLHRLRQVSNTTERDDDLERPLPPKTDIPPESDSLQVAAEPVASGELGAGKRISKEVKLGGVPCGGESPDDRPIMPGIGKNLASFEELIEATLRTNQMEPTTNQDGELNRPTPKRPFLRQGQGISRFGLKEANAKFKKKPKQKGHSPRLQSSQGVGLKSASSPLLCGSKQWGAMSPAGILAGNDSREPRISTPMSLVRCSSEDSFIIRRDQRLESEKKELHEFELLEEAANMSYSSQLSLFNDLPKQSTSHQPDLEAAVYIQDRPREANIVPVNLTTITCPTKQTKSHHLQATVDDESENSSTVDMDETLKFSPSLAKGVEFNDEEAWESFSHGSPQSRHRTESSGSDVTCPHSSPSAKDDVWKSPVKRELLAESVGFQALRPVVHRLDTRVKSSVGKDIDKGRHITSAVEKSRITETPCPTHESSSTLNTKNGRSLAQVAYEFSDSLDVPVPNSGKLFVPPPPPSALVSKLFPALRQVEEPRKVPCSHQSKLHHHASEGHVPPSAESTSPVSSTEGDSGIRSLSSTSMALSEDLKGKLNQLEEEIGRYRAENSSLEKLRKEREDGVAHLRHEIAEFMKQKDEEMSRFEEYKREEIKKLKKERRVFGAYQQEATSARDRRDKEDIENLRRELLSCQEDLRSSEARWGATLSRYRMKIRSLEAENSELKEDLRMMEQERLRSWQIQVEQEVLAKKKSMERTDHTSAKAGSSKTRKLKPANPCEQEERGYLKLSGKQGSLKRAPLRENLSQVPHLSQVPRYVNVQIESESDTNQSDCEDPTLRGDDRLAGYESDSDSCISEVAEEIVMQVVGSDNEIGVRSKNKMPEKENIKPVTKGTATRNLLTNFNSAANTELIRGSSQTLPADNRGAKKNKSVRFSISPTPSPPKAATPPSSPPKPATPPSSPPKAATLPAISRVRGMTVPPISRVGREPGMTAPKSPPKAATMPATFRTGREVGMTMPKEFPQRKQVAPTANKSEAIQTDGSKVLTFSNGTKKVVSADGKSNSVYFFNGDIKHVKSDQTVVYYYSEFKVTQTNYPDGLEVIEFPNKQCEKHYPNGTKEIHFPNDTVKYIYPNGEEESVFPDGLSQRNFPNGNVTLHMPNGIKEYYTADYKRREYPGGTVKTVYPDGKQETHYASGRVKIKDKNGRIITDAVTT